MSSAAIPLMGVQPQFTSPLTNFTQLLQAKDLASQVRLRDAQASEYGAQADARKQAAEDQGFIQKTLSNPEASKRLHSGDFSDFEGKIGLGSLSALQKYHNDTQEAAAKLSSEERANRQGALDEVNKTLSSIALAKNPDGTPDVARQNALWQSGKQFLANNGVLKNAGVDTTKLPDTITPQTLQDFQASIGGSVAALETSQKIAEQGATIAQKNAAAGKDVAETGIKQGQLDNMTDTGLLPDEVVKQKEAEATLAQTQAQRAETARHNRVDEGTAAARERDEAARVSHETQGLTANQVNQAATKKAQPYQKMTDAANTTLSKIDETLNLVKAGASGQELAKIGIIPALTGMNRINHTEINAQGSGSRGIEGNVEAFFNKIAGQGSLSADQKEQMVALLNQAKNHITSRQQIINDHLDALGTSNSREEIELHERNTRKKLADFENGVTNTPAADPKAASFRSKYNY